MTTIDLNHETICINPTDDLTLYDKNLIMSRIEKFLFAICSLDSSDLPIPLSRIEELYNCLVTGDTPPTFDPLSRAEKFLMACLGAYDINKLPEPLSRSEVLLKKIATGDSNLEDVDNLQSKYEFLLAYIIQNGGIGGIDGDISYMKYTLTEKETTLYNTKKHLVRSAILIGDTKLIDELGNECDEPNTPKIHMGAYVNETTGELVASAVSFYTDFLKSPNVNFMIKGNSRYKRVAYYDKDKKYITGANSADQYNGVFRPHDIVIRPENAVYYRISASLSLEADATYTPDTKLSIVDQYGETLYPTELVSVKMPVLTTTGKNLFKTLEWESGFISAADGKESAHNQYIRTRNYIDIRPNATYTATGYMEYFMFYDSDKNLIGGIKGSTSKKLITFTTPSNAKYLKLRYFLSSIPTLEAMLNTENMLELGEQRTGEYEPYKSNILTVNEEVVLRSLPNGVCDTLNLMTGEYVQRIGEITFNGSETWSQSGNITPNHYCAFTYVQGSKNEVSYNIVCNSLPVRNILSPTIDYEGCVFNKWTSGDRANLVVKIANSKLSSTSVAGIKAYLQSNPLTVQYELATPVIKTVDLSIVDQDGNNTKLSTFDDITYVTLSSEGLIPEAELEVATKNEEVLNTLSLEMDDISTAQDILEESSNIQSENVYATMIATTEIYEGLL